MSPPYDVAIIGGGIVGLATAYAINRNHPRARLVLLEKESAWAQHQTGHNSGVIHSGIYYKPGSFKASFCRAGNGSMVEFCQRHGIPFEVCGKVIVATRQDQLPQLEMLHDRGVKNGLRVKRIGPAELKDIEPHVVGLQAIRVFDAGIVDYKAVCGALAGMLGEAGCELRLNYRVQSVIQHAGRVELASDGTSLTARHVINCAGLHSDRIATLSGSDPGIRIVPFRGEYFELRHERRHLVRNLIYPVPNPDFPFLGVHFTRMIDGRVDAGPNAVLAFAREGYAKSNVNLADLYEVLRFAGFRKLARRYWREGLQEIWRSFSKRAFVRSLQELIPDIAESDLDPAPAGIRAQALNADGSLVDDFHVVHDGRCVHVCNAPSPAATASLEIGRHVAQMVKLERL